MKALPEGLPLYLS